MPHGLDSYRRKRDPRKTPEPFAGAVLASGSTAFRFVVQQHAARRMHWDLRLEIGGVLVSWAVPRGPSPDVDEKRLAVQTEDHPIEYADFEGVIPAGNYGAGSMILWDRGVYRSVDDVDPEAGLESGKLDLEMFGHKLRGRWALVRIKKSETGREWLLLKKTDAYAAKEELVVTAPQSIVSGLSVEELGEGRDRNAELAAMAADAGGIAAAWDDADLRPMLAEITDKPFSDEEWIFELKYDGVRALLSRTGSGNLQLQSRRRRDYRATFPELVLVGTHLPCDSFVIDAEIIAADPGGSGSFEMLQQRLGIDDPLAAERASRSVPVLMYCFDLPYVAGYDLRAVPLVERKRILPALLPQHGPLRYTDHVATEGIALFEAARDFGVEGIIAKRGDSPYRPGARSRHWLKIKIPRTSTLVVVGYTPGKGSRRELGSLLIAWWADGALTYAGNVGSGLDGETIAFLLEHFAATSLDSPAFATAATAPPAGSRFVEPQLVAEVRYTEVTSGGLLRHPVFVRLRHDLHSTECPAPVEASPRGDRNEPPPTLEAHPEEPHPRFAVSNRDKVFWPHEGYTKGDLLDYYRAIWPWLAPYLRDRPLVLTRYPDGIDGKSFFQKNAPDFVPEWLDTCRIDDAELFLCNELEALLYVVNLGCIPLHMWSARRGSIEHPDWTILDLDPKEAPFENVVRVAKHIHNLLEPLGVPHFIKTSGQAGLHILIPLNAKLTHTEARTFAEVIARVVVVDLGDIATIARPLGARGGKVYVDFLQNGYGKTIVAPFSARPRPGAPVSMPLRWSQVAKRLDPASHTIKTAPKRMKRSGDPLLPVLTESTDVAAALRQLAEQLI